MDWTKAYHEFLLADAEAKRRQRDDGCFHCSDLGQCPRKVIWRLEGDIPPYDLGRLRRQRQGTAIHQEYESPLAQVPSVAVEVDLTEWLPENWSGTCDGLYLAEGGAINDYKTVNANAFRFSKTFPKHGDCLQLGSYWGAAERMVEATIEEGTITYIGLGAFDEELQVPVDPVYKEEALREMAVLEHQYEEFKATGVLPDYPQPELKSKGWQQNWECSPAYCGYRAAGKCEGGPEAP